MFQVKGLAVSSGHDTKATIFDREVKLGESVTSVGYNTPTPACPRPNHPAGFICNHPSHLGVAAANESLDDVIDRHEARRRQGDPPEDSLSRWWWAKAADEIERTVPKAIEYGSTDLIDIGLMLARTMGRTIDEEEAAELGVFFYLIGKVARWQSAIERGERPSDDTLFDIGVYVRMAQRIRDAGAWPGIEQA